jgi:hypothetical protein
MDWCKLTTKERLQIVTKDSVEMVEFTPNQNQAVCDMIEIFEDCGADVPDREEVCRIIREGLLK